MDLALLVSVQSPAYDAPWWNGALVGDGLVPVASALGRHRDPAKALPIPKSHQWIGHGIGHLELLNRPEVYAQLRAWFGEGAPVAARPRRVRASPTIRP